MARSDAYRALLQRGQQPGLLAEFDDVRGKRRRARIAGLELLQRTVQVRDEPPLVDLIMAQNCSNIAIGSVGERKQPMLDLDVVVGARQRHASGGFECPAALLVQPTDKLLQIDCGHGFLPGETPPFRVRRLCVRRNHCPVNERPAGWRSCRRVSILMPCWRRSRATCRRGPTSARTTPRPRRTTGCATRAPKHATRSAGRMPATPIRAIPARCGAPSAN